MIRDSESELDIPAADIIDELMFFFSPLRVVSVKRRMPWSFLLLLLFLISAHCIIQKDHMLCSSGEIAQFAYIKFSKSGPSATAAELGGRLPTSAEVRELILANQGPLFNNQTWLPVSGNDLMLVGIKDPEIPSTCTFCRKSDKFHLSCECHNEQGSYSKTSISYDTCENSVLQNVDGQMSCVKTKPFDSWDCESILGISGLGHPYNLCWSHRESNPYSRISTVEIVYISPKQKQSQQGIKSCTSETTMSVFYYSNPCPPGFSCISSLCVELNKAHAQIIKFGQGPPNNVYFAFSLWDHNCRPIALPPTVLSSTLQVYQKIPGKVASEFVRQSAKESWNGVLPQPIRSKTKIVLLCDHSGSLKLEWNTIRASVVQFVETLLEDPSVNYNKNKFLSKVPLIGPGPTKRAPKSILVNAMVFDGRDELLSISSEFDDFTEITTPGYLEALGTATISDRGYDPSTNLNGAIVQGLKLLKSDKERRKQRKLRKQSEDLHKMKGSNNANDFGTTEDDEEEIRQSYLVVFTDGTDQANRVQDVQVMAAVKDAEKSISIYGVLLAGESTGGGSGSNLAQMKRFCPAGVYTIAKLDEMQQKFAEISGLLNAHINNRGVFLYCASIRSGTAEVQLRVEGSVNDRRDKTFVVNTSRFNTKDSVCTESEASNIKVPNPSFSIQTRDLAEGFCEGMLADSDGWWKKSDQCMEEESRWRDETERVKRLQEKRLQEERLQEKRLQEQRLQEQRLQEQRHEEISRIETRIWIFVFFAAITGVICLATGCTKWSQLSGVQSKSTTFASASTTNNAKVHISHRREATLQPIQARLPPSLQANPLAIPQKAPNTLSTGMKTISMPGPKKSNLSSAHFSQESNSSESQDASERPNRLATQTLPQAQVQDIEIQGEHGQRRKRKSSQNEASTEEMKSSTKKVDCKADQEKKKTD
jgi:hypothetical protein